MLDHETMILQLRKVGSSKKEFHAILDDWLIIKQDQMKNMDERKSMLLANMERSAELLAKECDLIHSLQDRLTGKEVALVLPSELIAEPAPEPTGFFKRKGKK